MRVTQLFNQHIQAENGQEPRVSDDGEGPVIEEYWELVFTDRGTGDQIRLKFYRDVRDEIVRQLTGGIVLAGGDLPKI